MGATQAAALGPVEGRLGGVGVGRRRNRVQWVHFVRFGPDVGGGDEGYGRIVPIGDEAALADAIDAALRDPGDPGPRIARAMTFTPERALARYERLIREVCGQARAAAPKATPATAHSILR